LLQPKVIRHDPIRLYLAPLVLRDVTVHVRQPGAFHANDDAASVRTLLIDDRPVAALFLLAGEGATWFHQSGWDPAFADRSVGRSILVDAMRDSCEQGRDFHLLTGDHTYKQWWATDDQPVATVEVARW